MESGKNDGEESVKASSNVGEADLSEDKKETDEVEETAEFLMTDMTLDDDTDKIRDPDPGTSWIYHIEMYPWHGDDVNEHFLRLVKLASYTKLCLKKKPVSHESEDPERMVNKVMERQRRGSLHLYAESYQIAKAIMRHSTWKNMISKELTFEITKRCPDNDNIITARIDVDTCFMSKIKFRHKAKGSFEARTAKVSNLPKNISRDFLDIVFSRSYVMYNGSDSQVENHAMDSNLHQLLEEMPDFNGSLILNCLNRGSCRAFVLAHKAVNIMGKDLSIVASDSQTMVMPSETQNLGFKMREESKAKAAVAGIQMGVGREQGVRESAAGRTGSLTRVNSPITHNIQTARIHPLLSIGRPRGMGGSRGMIVTQQPASAAFTRIGPGMPVPMTGRQKMNEKIRRNHPNNFPGTSNPSMHPSMGASVGFRAANMPSIGDSFKQEIASLQSELDRSTQAIEAKIERLKEESSYYNNYNDEMQMYVEGEWEDDNRYEYAASQEDYYDDGQSDCYAQNYDINPQEVLRYDLAPYDQAGEPNMGLSHHIPRRQVPCGRGRFHNTGQRPLSMTGNFDGVRNAPQMRSASGRGADMAMHGGHGMSGYW